VDYIFNRFMLILLRANGDVSHGLFFSDTPLYQSITAKTQAQSGMSNIIT
jgi:hypothetical protein